MTPTPPLKISPEMRQLDKIELTAVSYIFLPVLVMMLGWLNWPFALILGGLSSAAWFFVARRQRHTKNPLSINYWTIIFITSILWISLSGIAGHFHLNSDWDFRMSVLHDLTMGAWPVSYGKLDGQDVILRLPMGYYLTPALIGKVLGGSEDSARWALWAWTTVGACLFLGLVIHSLPTPRHPWQLITALLGAILFSGMDVIGALMRDHTWPVSGMHLEWWADLFQYSSNTTLMFWVPNHALPGWIGAILIWRHRSHGLDLAAAGLLILSAVVWAPLVAIGLFPLLLLCSWRELTLRSWLHAWITPASLCLLPPALLAIRFITFGVPAEAAGTLNEAGALGPVVVRWFIFSLMEWGFIAWLVLRSNMRQPLVWAAILELLLLPWLRFGPGNDIVMRGGIPAITLLMMAALHVLTQASIRERATQAALAACLLVGAVTPYEEIYRSFHPSLRYESQGKTFVERNGLPWHYVGLLPQESWLRFILGHPTQLKNQPETQPSH
jgi:hypothetical protein